MQVVDCTLDQHGDAILAILNHAIVHSTALYDYKPRSPESMVSWFAAKRTGRYPVIGVIKDEQLAGFATYGSFRAWPAYKYSVEHSVYVHPDHRGKGLGLALMQRLIVTAAEQQYHVMIGGIDVANEASIALHKRLGFTHAGTIQQAGFKFARWLDLAFYQRILDTPDQPVDG
jgi:L-amino acid N-acyltransferase